MTRFTGLPFSFDIKDRGDAILGKSAPTVIYKYGDKLVDQDVLTNRISKSGRATCFLSIKCNI